MLILIGLWSPTKLVLKLILINCFQKVKEKSILDCFSKIFTTICNGWNLVKTNQHCKNNNLWLILHKFWVRLLPLFKYTEWKANLLEMHSIKFYWRLEKDYKIVCPFVCFVRFFLNSKLYYYSLFSVFSNKMVVNTGMISIE